MSVPDLTTDQMTDEHFATTMRNLVSELNRFINEATRRGLVVGVDTVIMTHRSIGHIERETGDVTQIILSLSRPL